MVDVVDAAIVVLLAAIAAILIESLRRGNVAVAVNALLSIAAVLLPTAFAAFLDVSQGLSIQVPPELTLWIAVAGVLHSIGMLGPYDSVWWWDHLTHLVSAALVAALLYAGLLVLAARPGGFEASRLTVAALTVLLTFLAGAFWEFVELVAREVGERLDVEPVLVHYGWRDTVLDLVFDVLGAVVVVLFDVRILVVLADESIRATRLVLVAGSWLFLLGTVALAALVVRDVGE